MFLRSLWPSSHSALATPKGTVSTFGITSMTPSAESNVPGTYVSNSEELAGNSVESILLSRRNKEHGGLLTDPKPDSSDLP